MIPNEAVHNVERTLVSVQQPAKSPRRPALPCSTRTPVNLSSITRAHGTNRDVGEFWRDLPGYLSRRSRESEDLSYWNGSKR
jgi:hypothetical protein